MGKPARPSPEHSVPPYLRRSRVCTPLLEILAFAAKQATRFSALANSAGRIDLPVLCRPGTRRFSASDSLHNSGRCLPAWFARLVFWFNLCNLFSRLVPSSKLDRRNHSLTEIPAQYREFLLALHFTIRRALPQVFAVSPSGCAGAFGRPSRRTSHVEIALFNTPLGVRIDSK